MIIAHPWKSSYMVLMSVCNDNSLNLVFPLSQETDIRKDLGHSEVIETAAAMNSTLVAVTGMH